MSVGLCDLERDVRPWPPSDGVAFSANGGDVFDNMTLGSEL